MQDWACASHGSISCVPLQLDQFRTNDRSHTISVLLRPRGALLYERKVQFGEGRGLCTSAIRACFPVRALDRVQTEISLACLLGVFLFVCLCFFLMPRQGLLQSSVGLHVAFYNNNNILLGAPPVFVIAIEFESGLVHV